MKRIIPFPNRPLNTEEAATWIARLDGEPLSESEQAELKEWLDKDPRHPEALYQLAVLWSDLDCMKILADLSPLRSDRPAAFKTQNWSRWLGRGQWVTAAVLIFVGLILSASFSRWSLEPTQKISEASAKGVQYQTGIGEQSTIVLNDGSKLVLNTDSVARVVYDDHERAVYLGEGEALFEVVKNPKIPFVVYAGQGRVTAIGTAFNVRVRSDRVDVVVAEGVVEIASSSDGKDRQNPRLLNDSHLIEDQLILQQGEATSFQQEIDQAQHLNASELKSRLAWRSGKWLFEGETLAEVVAEVNRYSSQRIEIRGAGLAEYRIGGYFDIGNINALLNALIEGFGVQVSRLDRGVIVLSAEPLETLH